MERLDRGLGSRHYPNQDKVDARIAVIAKDRRVDAYLRTQTGTGAGTGKPALAWRFDQEPIGRRGRNRLPFHHKRPTWSPARSAGQLSRPADQGLSGILGGVRNWRRYAAGVIPARVVNSRRNDAGSV
jgi:hypothetical protein